MTENVQIMKYGESSILFLFYITPFIDANNTIRQRLLEHVDVIICKFPIQEI